MPRVCTICTHPERAEIDAAVVNGAPNRRVAAQYGVAETSLRRHAAHHLPTALVKAAEAEQVVGALDLLAQATELLDSARRILKRAENRKDDAGARIALQANKEAAGRLELLARIMTAAMQGERTSTEAVSCDSDPGLDERVAHILGLTERKALGNGLGNG